MQMFVVRVMESADDDALRGVVRRVADGSEQPFHDSDQLVALLGHRVEWAGDDGLGSAASSTTAPDGGRAP